MSNVDYDLAAVALEFREMVTKRIAAIEAFKQERGRPAAARHAAALGIKTAQFYNLVKLCRDNPDPTLLAVRGRKFRTEDKFSDEQLKVIETILTDSPSAALKTLVGRVLERFNDAGVQPPKKSAVRREITRQLEKSNFAGSAEDARLVVDHAVINIPVEREEGFVQRPLGTFVIDTKINKLIGISLSFGMPTHAQVAAAIRDAVQKACPPDLRSVDQPREKLSIGLPTTLFSSECPLSDALEEAGVSTRIRSVAWRDHGLAVRAAVGGRYNGISLWRLRIWQRDNRPYTGAGVPLTEDEAVKFVASRLCTPTSQAFASLHAEFREELLKALAEIERDHDESEVT